MTKDKIFQMRVSASDTEALTAVKKFLGIPSTSGLLRFLVQQEIREKGIVVGGGE